MSAKRVVVVDIGTGFIKCGFAGENFPRAVFPCMVGRPVMRFEEKIDGKQIKDINVGDECSDLRHALEISYPVENGIIRNWEDMLYVFDYTFFDRLRIRPEECKVLLTEAPMNPKENREKLVRVMFEQYKFSAVYVQIQAVLTLYAQGLSTGVVVDSGEGVTHVVPVYDGFAIRNASRRINIAGRAVTNHLIKLLTNRGYSFNRTADFETVRQMKEKLCYVSYDIETDKRLAVETTALVKSYTLPDGRTVQIGRERYEAAEVLFHPGAINVEGPGIAEEVFSAIQASDISIRPDLYKHIVLSGGSSMFAGLPSRLEKDIKNLHFERILQGDQSRKDVIKIRVEDQPRRMYMVFTGGAVLADIMKDRDEDWWATRDEFKRHGLAHCLAKLPTAI
eukprot:tig00022075_g23621.t1